MTSTKKLSVLLFAIAAANLVGCMKMDKEKIQSMKPARAAELDMLNQFVGDWKGTMTCDMSGSDETCTGTGTSHYEWDLDRNVLVEHGDFTSDFMGNMKALGHWSWDYKKDRFCMTWVDTWGNKGKGHAKTKDNGKTWTMRTKSCGPMGSTSGKGCMTFVNSNTMEMTWKEYCCWGLIKVFEMKGTATRQPAGSATR